MVSVPGVPASAALHLDGSLIAAPTPADAARSPTAAARAARGAVEARTGIALVLWTGAVGHLALRNLSG